MNDPDNFLSRWSRRKREAATEDPQQKKPDAGEAHVPASAQETRTSRTYAKPRRLHRNSTSAACRRSNRSAPEPTSRRSCDQGCRGRCGMRRFAAPGPLTRQFGTSWGPRRTIGMQLGRMGFRASGTSTPISMSGAWSPSFSVKHHAMTLNLSLRQIAWRIPLRYQSDNCPNAADPPQATLPPAENLPQRNENAAAQTEPSESAPEKKISRRHGGAIPK